jgi:SNF2 family DNA or RNA helicase
MQSLDEYLDAYGGHLAKKCRDRLRPLHDPQGEPHPRVKELLRTPFPAQAHVITGAAKLLERNKTAFLICEMGTGKSLMGIGTVHAHADGKPYRVLVFCPGQLVGKWQREIKETLPEVTTQAITNWKEAVALLDKKGVKPTCGEWYVIARDRAKLGAKWRPAVVKARRKVKTESGLKVTREVNTCPTCGRTVADEDGMLLPLEVLERKPTYCSKCQGPLWTFTGELRRWAPATFIHKKLKGFFDYLICDELHEEKSQTSAQANALGSLAAACKRTIALTGTLLGGYSEHVRPLLFRLSPRSVVQEGFDWSDAMKFAERYGRIKTVIREKEGGDGPRNRQSKGSSSSKTRSIEPGILPGLFGNHLLDKAVFLQLEQVATRLPKLQEELVPVAMEGAQAQAYKDLEEDMLAAVRTLVQRGNRQLLGSMVNSLLYYEDTCYAAWDPLGYYEGDRDGEGAFITVHVPSKLSSDVIYPKEQALLDLLRKEKQAGRQCWVYVQITEKHGLLERLRSLLDRHGLKVGVLKANVELAKREEWIAKNGKNVDVVLSHPKLVETGLDLFDKGGNHNFCTLIFYQTGYNLFTLRQASRRSWRIGQEKECKVVYLYYAGTMQERAMGLMGRKLAAAEAIDGKFSTEGLAAAAEDEGSLAMMMAKNLMDKLDEDPALAWAKTEAVQGTNEVEQPMARKKFPKNAAKPEIARAAKDEPEAKEPEILPFVKPEQQAEAPTGMSNLAVRLAKIRLGRQLMAAK